MAEALTGWAGPGASSEGGRAARWGWAAALAVVLVGSLTVAPLWIGPLVVTNDGPSHVYNAMLADAVRAGRQPYATYFRLDDRGLRPNQASYVLLRELGARVGWETAERILLTAAMGGLFVMLLILLGAPRERRATTALAPVAGWLATSWFVWIGFYDFVLSALCYTALILVLGRPLTATRLALMQVAYALLYWTHFFTFTVAIGLGAAVLAWRATRQERSWVQLGALAPAVLLFLAESASGGPGAGALKWAQPWESLSGLVLGDIVVSVDQMDRLGGFAIMAAVWGTVVQRLRAVGREGVARPGGLELFGILLLLGSLVAPSTVGEGGYINIRLRFLGVLALLPAIGATLATLRSRYLLPAAAVLLLGLGLHSAYLVRDSRRVHRDLLGVDQMFRVAGATEGAWVRSRLTIYRRGLFRIAAYRHLADRVAVRRRFVVVDNYEALYRIFPTAWRAQPDWVTFRQSIGGLTARLVPGELPWPGAVYVLHESDRVLQMADPRLEARGSVVGRGLAVTRVARRP